MKWFLPALRLKSLPNLVTLKRLEIDFFVFFISSRLEFLLNMRLQAIFNYL